MERLSVGVWREMKYCMVLKSNSVLPTPLLTLNFVYWVFFLQHIKIVADVLPYPYFVQVFAVKHCNRKSELGVL